MSLPSRRRNANTPIDTNINAINVPAEINCAKNSNGNIDPMMTAIVVIVTSARFGKCLSFNFPNQEGNKPSRPNE